MNRWNAQMLLIGVKLVLCPASVLKANCLSLSTGSSPVSWRHLHCNHILHHLWGSAHGRNSVFGGNGLIWLPNNAVRESKNNNNGNNYYHSLARLDLGTPFFQLKALTFKGLVSIQKGAELGDLWSSGKIGVIFCLLESHFDSMFVIFALSTWGKK